jgi:hypothetical protein
VQAKRPLHGSGRSLNKLGVDSYFFGGVEEDIELDEVVEFVAVAFVSDGGAVVFAAVALVSAGAVVVVVVLVSVVVAFSAAVVFSAAFFWQADRLTARTAAAATEVRIRIFMDCSPGGLSPDAELIHGFVSSRNRDRPAPRIFVATSCGFQAGRPLAPGEDRGGRLRV